jgi:tripartite-type tricarboxylate transporter receptor subunit TctC
MGERLREQRRRGSSGELMRKLLTRLILGAALFGLECNAVTAQDYPTRPITIIVPFPAGGATDTLARFLAEKCAPVSVSTW